MFINRIKDCQLFQVLRAHYNIRCYIYFTQLSQLNSVNIIQKCTSWNQLDLRMEGVVSFDIQLKTRSQRWDLFKV